jgi:carbon storage regulator
VLVLSRKKNESILIDGCIAVRVLEIGKNGVRLGIDAPGDVKIVRSELLISDDAELAPELACCAAE